MWIHIYIIFHESTKYLLFLGLFAIKYPVTAIHLLFLYRDKKCVIIFCLSKFTNIEYNYVCSGQNIPNLSDRSLLLTLY